MKLILCLHVLKTFCELVDFFALNVVKCVILKCFINFLLLSNFVSTKSVLKPRCKPLLLGKCSNVPRGTCTNILLSIYLLKPKKSISKFRLCALSAPILMENMCMHNIILNKKSIHSKFYVHLNEWFKPFLTSCHKVTLTRKHPNSLFYHNFKTRIKNLPNGSVYSIREDWMLI